jgi:3-deoxy-D-manno-octulosonate 8-phosphate phosphatase (KDO 8-P phosphatase)
LLQRSGIEVGIISSRQSDAVSRRMESLGVAHVIQGRHDKLQALRELLESAGVAPEEAAFVGDDLIDLPAFGHVGLAIAVANAVPAVREHADWTTVNRGGEGAVREVCELLLRSKGLLEDHINRYLRGE